ncbi:hypothetical protein SHKM778_24720 [Streptomyces sp. KM77-8]|uniref:ABC transporter ATP-binding protein n=1 Tax=Streptomyces haneummycinicus TaxID=3074435 RepID=A0AAT9HFA3_9ACTN
MFGEEVTSFEPASMLSRHGVAIVPQELSLLPDRTVAENVLSGVEPGHRWFPPGAACWSAPPNSSPNSTSTWTRTPPSAPWTWPPSSSSWWPVPSPGAAAS